MKIYLAGPMAGLDYNGANDWRIGVSKKLSEYGIVSYSPLRWKEFLDNGKRISGKGAKNASHPLGTTKGIMTRDYFDVCQADVVFANFLDSKRISIGTAMELAWAFAKQKPVVAVGEPGNPHLVHPMMTEAISYAVHDLQEALEIVVAILVP